MVSISFVHDGVAEAMQGFPVETVTPCEGTGYEIGSMSIIKGARNLDEAKKFYDWALTPRGAEARRARPSSSRCRRNKATPVDPRVPDFTEDQADRLRLRQVRRQRRAHAA